MGCNIVSTVGDYCGRTNFPHVLRLTIIRDGWYRFLFPLLLLLPTMFRNRIKRIWPGYFLPAQVVLKKLKPGWDEEFDNEKHMYVKLEPLQGHIIPMFYGEAQCEGTRALVLSDVGGVAASDQHSALPRARSVVLEKRRKNLASIAASALV